MYIVIDMGGTKTRVASFKNFEDLLDIERFNTQSSLEKQKILLDQAIDKVSENKQILKICLGVAGVVDKKSQKFIKLPNIPYLNNKKFEDLISISSQLYVYNDAAIAGLGEAVYGAGKSYERVAYLTLSTGVGGVIINKRKIDINQPFFEPGKMIINISQSGKFETFESHCSGTSFEKKYNQSPKECNDRDIWEDYTKYLYAGIINIISMWAPEVIVLGGGVSNKFTTHIKKHLDKLMEHEKFLEKPEIVQAVYTDDAGILGGIYLLSKT